jgi:integrase
MSKNDRVPTYRRHRQSGQAIVTLPDGLGGRRDVLLGKYGTAASRKEYARVIAEWEANGRTLPNRAAAGDLTVNELAVSYLAHAEQHYRHPDGTQTGEYNDTKLSLRPLKHLYGHTAAKEFGPLALKAVRELMVRGYEHPKFGQQQALSRGVINQRIGRIRRMFRWAVENELIPSSVLHGLEAVRGLERGRSAARETEPVRPAPEAFIRAVLPFLRPQVAAMVQIQLLTGMRPGEVVIIRGIDLDTSGAVWFYHPGSDQGPHGKHKTAWRGHGKVIAIGPKAQEILRQWLRPKLDEYLFQPREAVAALRAEQRARRKSKVQPSQVDRRKRRPKFRPGARYRVGSYAVAIARACELANVPHFHPHQIRHTKATEIRREFGLDAARAVLGHRSPSVTEVYAELDMGQAAEVMGKLG